MTAFLVIVFIIGNLLLISGAMFGDLADVDIAWFIVIAAIAMDCYLIYKIIQNVSESHEQKRVVEAARNVNEIINRYSPSNVLSFQEAKILDVDLSLVNKEVVLCVKEYKNGISNLLQQSSKVNKKLMTILSCSGCITETEKFDYLSSNLTEIESLKNESDELHEKIAKNKIELLNEDGDLLLFLKSAFSCLLHSKKCTSDNVAIKEILCEKVPNDLSLFQFKYAPPVLFVNDFFFCLFTNVILVFDKNGIFSTAIDPTALTISVHRCRANIYVRNDKPTTHQYVGADSKLIQTGETKITWMYTRNDGFPDRRYSYNPKINFRTDVYEYGEIALSIMGANITFITSSNAAVEMFESVAAQYSTCYKDFRDPILPFLTLVKSVSNGDPTIDDIISAYRDVGNNNYFCKEIVCEEHVINE